MNSHRMMNTQLKLDPTGGDLLTSAWKELDAKFLSNDTPTTGQRILQPVTQADRIDHILSHSSLYIRASDLTLFLENVDIFHLKQHFQTIVESVFGFNTKYPGWSLRSITKSSNPRESSVILKLLGATGSLLTLATRLLDDPGFFIEIGLDKLPYVLAQRIVQGDVPPFFSSRLCVTEMYSHTSMASPVIKCLRVNTFEFFFLSFASHICSLKGFSSTTDYLIGWGNMTDNLYNNLVDDYLAYFFPCNGQGVPTDNFRLTYQQVNDSMYISQSLRSHMMNIDSSTPNHKNVATPRLLKSSFLMDQTPTPSQRVGDAFFRKNQIQKEVWRTETILLICTEIWMAHAPGTNYLKSSSPITPDQAMLPSVDVVKAVRMVVRHCHFFLNCVSACLMHPMEELRRDVYPTYQKKLYKFLRYLFLNWPLDNSFRIVYETWLSFVQPWRYVHYERARSSPTKEGNDEPVDSRWYGFIQENVLFYTKLFNVMLGRMGRVDFATTKNAMMFYRVAKVFTSHEYFRTMLMDIDNVIMSYEQPYAGQLNGISPRSPTSPSYSTSYGRYSSPGDSQRNNAMVRIASLRNVIKDWEGHEFTYEPLFSDTNKKIMFRLIENAKLGKTQLQEVIDATLLQQTRNQSWWDSFIGANKHNNAVVGQSLNELSRAIGQLDAGIIQFAGFFEIPLVDHNDPLRTPVFTPTKLPKSKFIGSSTLDGTVLDGTESRVTILPSGTFTCDMLVPVGNPDYAGPRSDECGVLVTLFRNISGRLNDRFAGEIMRWYFQRSICGRLARATFSEPVEYFDVERRGRVREKVRKVLPPRISLRFMSSINFLCIVFGYLLVCMFLGMKYSILPFCSFCWLIFIFVRAITEPDTKLDDVVYLFGDRNYNVDFRGRKEKPVLEQG